MNKKTKQQKFTVVFCIPNFSWQRADASAMWHMIPYNICLLAAMVKDFCEVIIIDANLDNDSHEQFIEKITQAKADVVGITVSMDQFAPSGHLAVKLVRNALPESIIFMGGVYPTINAEQVIMDKNLDYAFRGEGEYGVRSFLRYLMFNEEFPEKGLVWHQDSRKAPFHTGKITMQEKADFIQKLDELPLPAYDLIDFTRYTISAPRLSVDAPYTLPFARIQTSRGCPQGCCFCQVKEISGNKFRPRSPEKIIEEMLWFKNKYGIKSFIVDDDNVVTQRSRAIKLFTLMAEKIQLPWKAIAMAVFKLDKELIDLMALSGCKYMSIAIESGSSRILKDVIKKPVDFEHAKEMTAYAKQKGIYVSSNFIIGFPTETWEEVRQTCAFAEELDADYVKLFTAIPLKHTKLWDMCQELNAFKEGFSHEKISWNEGQLSSEYFHNDELTILRAYEWDRINFSCQEKIDKTAKIMNITHAELDKIRRDTRQNVLNTLCKKD